MTLEAHTDAAPSRKAGLFTAKNVLTLLVIFGCGALIAGVALYAVSSQGQHPDVGDGGFLSEQPCGPPCFLGITPGVTKTSGAFSALRSQPFFASCAATPSIINCQEIVQVGLQGDDVNIVSFKPASEITTAQTLDKYGPPDHVLVFISSMIPGGHPATKMRLFYDGMRAMIDLPDQNDVQFIAKPGTPLSNIAYLSEAQYASYLQQIAGQAIAWQGYRTYQADVQP